MLRTSPLVRVGSFFCFCGGAFGVDFFQSCVVRAENFFSCMCRFGPPHVRGVSFSKEKEVTSVNRS